MIEFLLEGKGVYVEGNEFAHDHAPGKWNYFGLYDYFGSNYEGDGTGWSPPTGGNIQMLVGQPGTWTQGMREEYMYQQPPDHYVDLISSNGGTIAFTCQGGEGRLVFHRDGIPEHATIHATYVFGAVKDAPSSVSKADLMTFYMAHLLPDSCPPQVPEAPVACVCETGQGPRLALTWAPVTEDVNGGQESVEYYAVHRDTTAHFLPATGNRVAKTGLAQYLDHDPLVVGNPIANHFYVIRAVDMRGNTSGSSATVGEIDFSLGDPEPRSRHPAE